MSVDISLLSSVDDPADARLHRIVSALLRSGLTCEIRTRGEAARAPEGAEFHSTLNGAGFIKRIGRDLLLPFTAKGKVWIVVSPDLLVTTRVVGRLRGKKIVADVHEDYLRLLEDRAWTKKFAGLAGVFGRLAASTATSAAKSADLTTVADSHVPPMTAKNRLVVRNLPDATLLTPSQNLSATPTAIYIGDVRKSRGLYTILDSAVLAPHWRFEIVGNVAAADTNYLNLWKLENPDDAARIAFHGKLDPKSSWKFAENAWVGLTLLDSTPAFVDAVPSKLYEYMAVGLAIISTPLPRCVDLIEKSGSGLIAASAEEVASALNSFENDLSSLQLMRTKGREWAEVNLDSAREYGALVAAIHALL